MFRSFGVLSSSSTNAVTLRGGPGLRSARLLTTPGGRGRARLGGRPAVVLEERDGPGLAVVLDGEVRRPQIGDRLALLVERGDGQLHQPRRGPKSRRLLLGRQGEEDREGNCFHACAWRKHTRTGRHPVTTSGRDAHGESWNSNHVIPSTTMSYLKR